MQAVSSAFELVGVATIVVGFLAALWVAGRRMLQRDSGAAYDSLRSIFGRSVLLGLEILVAADLIRTIAVDPTLDNLYVLGLLVLIRTFLSWSLDVELEGVWPWRKRELRMRTAVATQPDGSSDSSRQP
jgi:uncharacterized membrane protein